MYTKTSSIPFLQFGEVFSAIPEAFRHNLERHHPMQVMQQSFAFLYQADAPIFLQAVEGLTLLVITDGEDKPLQEFVLHRIVKVNPGCRFNLLAMDGRSTVEIFYPKQTRFALSFLENGYHLRRITPHFNIREVTAFFYNVRGHNYSFPGTRQHCWELTYVDSGTLITEVNGITHTLKSNQLIFYAPEDYISQQTGDGTCSYLTVMFNMDMREPERHMLRCQVFSCTSSMQKDLEQFVHTHGNPWENDILFNALHHVMLGALQTSRPGLRKATATPMQQNFENELLNEILLYINENVYTSFNVEDLCNHFAISRSSLQQLFTQNLGVPPKQFISNVKLQKSRLLIKERKYNISEIASMLGYSSIHYFSRKFKQEYGFTPSEYANKLIG